jgi:hypothetical protein
MSSSVIPSLKYSFSRSGERLRKGRTATETAWAAARLAPVPRTAERPTAVRANARSLAD